MTTFTATYDPADNKLRLRASERLDAELYARVRRAGFSWAPKQELFVAPMWTPSRADLCTELAGDIDDEDTSLVDRAEARAERFEDYSDARTTDANQAHAAVARIADNIPFGQPILVGHHSERHARKDAARIENGMRRAVKMWETAQYWTDRAAGAIRHAKYLERPDVRARRIKGIEADLRKQQKYDGRARQFLRLWADPLRTMKRNDGAEWASLRAAVVALANSDSGYWSHEYKRPTYDYTGPLTLWEAAGGNTNGADPDAVAIATPEEICARAIANHTATVNHCARWIEHFTNRIAYEKAMLNEAGGTVTDRTGPEKGGACKCWASPRGGWSYVQKVNKVSVTVLDNWGNGGDCFTRTIPFDKLSAVMTAAEVQTARDTGMLIETATKDSKGNVEGFILRNAPLPEPTPEPEKEDRVCPDGPECLDEDCQAERERQGLPVATLDADTVRAMRATLKAGVTVAIVPDLFPTPAALAARMVELADILPGMRVLEPSAGTGNLVRAIIDNGAVVDKVVIEINARLAAQVQTLTPDPVICADFLSLNGELGLFDRIIMNPPFSGGADLKHIEHARAHLKEGGRIVALCADGPRQRNTLGNDPSTASYESLPAGSFAEAGTSVNVALVVIEG